MKREIERTAGGHEVRFDEAALHPLLDTRAAVKHRPCMLGESAEIVGGNVRRDPFWGPILFPQGPDGPLDEKELAAHLNDYERLIDGAAKVVNEFAGSRISGGYKAYDVEAVIECMQEQRDEEIEQAVEEAGEDQ